MASEKRNANIYAVFLLSGLLSLCILSGCGSGAGSGEDADQAHKNTKIISAKLHLRGEPNGYRGKALEFVLNRKLEENSEVRYRIAIESKTGFTIDGQGFLTTPRSFDEPAEKWLINIFLWIPRHDNRQLRKGVEEEINPGNIKELRIKLMEKQSGFSKETKVIASRTFSNL